MNQLPQEIHDKIKNYYFSRLHFLIHKKKIKKFHYQLKNDQPILNITEDLFDWFLDFEYAIRLPKLVEIPN